MTSNRTMRGYPLARLLPAVLAALTAFAVLPVIALGYWGARDNTSRLLRDRSELTIQAAVDHVEALLEPPRAQVTYLADSIARGTIDPDDRAAMRAFVSGGLAATPQVVGISYIRPDLTGPRYGRAGGAADEVDWSRVPGAAEDLEAARASVAAGQPWLRWSDPVFVAARGETLIPLRIALQSRNGFKGLLSAAISTSRLSAELEGLAAGTGQTPFILVGRDRVLAHPNLLPATATDRKPGHVRRLDEIGDPVLAGFHTLERNPLTASAPFHRAQGHWSWVGDATYAFVYRVVGTYGDEPWTVGLHAPGEASRRERWIVIGIAVGGSVLLILATLAAAMLGRVLARPALALADAARHAEALDFAGVRGFEPGPFAEFNAAGAALANMAAGLRWFEAYLPRRIVRRLMERGGGAPRSEQRVVTIMFTDLAGYSAFSAGRPAEEAAAYLNGLLAEIGPLIEGSGGTIDKYMGDAVMAFWGAPDELPDHAATACKAALSIADAVIAFNARRRAAGLEVCALRVGLHTGSVVVGNIGFEGRLDYTIVGEAVNLAKRLEQAGKAFAGNEVVVLASGATYDAAGEDPGFASEPAALPAEWEAGGPVWRLR